MAEGSMIDEPELWLASIWKPQLMHSASVEENRLTHHWTAGWNHAVTQKLDGIAEECTGHAASLALTGQIERSEQIRNVGCSIQEHRDAISEVENTGPERKRQSLMPCLAAPTIDHKIWRQRPCLRN